MKTMSTTKIADWIEKIRVINLWPLFLTNLYLAMVSTFYVYVAATSLIAIPMLALAVSILIGAANLFIALIVSYNTLAARKPLNGLEKASDIKVQDRNLKIFLSFAVPAFALNFVTNLVGPYISLPLLGSALALPVASPWFMGVCIFLGAFAALAFGLYNIVQIYEACQRIKPSLGNEKASEEELVSLFVVDNPTTASTPSSSQLKAPLLTPVRRSNNKETASSKSSFPTCVLS